MNNKTKKGFTLLELLIVIAILAILGAIVIFLLNPAETLKKARDSQRISDLSTIKTALGIYLTSVSSPVIDAYGSCASNVWYSLNGVTDTSVAGSEAATSTATAAELGEVDGTGWIPVNLSSLVGGSPISSFPIDPSNTITSLSAIANTDLVYRYTCSSTPMGFEIDAALESDAFTSTDDKRAKDGGNHTTLYEVGTSLTILPGTNDF